MSGFAANAMTFLEDQFSPMMVLAILFGVSALLGMFLGGSIIGALSAWRTRLKLRKIADANDTLEKLLVESRQSGVKLQAELDKLRSRCNGLEAKLDRGDESVDAVRRELSEAKAQVRQREKENALLKRAAEKKNPPTLIKRVRPVKESALSGSDTGIIPDDQIIPTLPEAELTANVDAYDLSDIEELGKQDA